VNGVRACSAAPPHASWQAAEDSAERVRAGDFLAIHQHAEAGFLTIVLPGLVPHDGHELAVIGDAIHRKPYERIDRPGGVVERAAGGCQLCQIGPRLALVSLVSLEAAASRKTSVAGVAVAAAESVQIHSGME
jgi:hypothetical protein